MMKTKLFFVFCLAAVVLVACSKNNDTTSSTVLAPPTWIQGTWANAQGMNVTQFTTDDLIQSSSSYKAMIAEGTITNFSQSSSKSTYTVNYTEQGLQGQDIYTSLTDSTMQNDLGFKYFRVK